MARGVILIDHQTLSPLSLGSSPPLTPSSSTILQMKAKKGSPGQHMSPSPFHFTVWFSVFWHIQKYEAIVGRRHFSVQSTVLVININKALKDDE